MKKFFSIFIIAVALVAVSCGGNANKAAEEAEVTDVEVIVENDTCCADSTKCCGADSTCCKEEVAKQ